MQIFRLTPLWFSALHIKEQHKGEFLSSLHYDMYIIDILERKIIQYIDDIMLAISELIINNIKIKIEKPVEIIFQYLGETIS